MPRKRDTLERRNRRFLLPLLELTLPALVFLFAINKITAAICDFFLTVAPTSACNFPMPDFVVYALAIGAALGVFGSAWRFYKDYVCHERFDGLL